MFPAAFMPGGLLSGAARLRQITKSMPLTVSNATGSIVAFTVTGTVAIYALWAEVTTAISSNHTAGFLRLNDQTATIDITLNTGIVLSSLLPGTIIYKESLTAVALNLLSNANAFFEEPASAGQPFASPFIVGKKTAAVTTIDYRYATTNTPSTGALLWNALYLPLSQDGALS